MSDWKGRGSAPPGRNPVPSYKILRPQRDGALDVTFTDDTVFGVTMHWVTADEGGGVSKCCYQHEPQGCEWHDEPFEWAGFVGVWWHNYSKKAVLRLAPRDYDVVAKACGIDLRWRGVRVRINPVNNGGGRTISAERVNTVQKPEDYPSHAIERSICLMLGVQRIPRQTAPTEANPEDVPL